MKTEEEKQKLENEVEELRKERDSNLKENEELKVELSLTEDRLQNIKVQLAETNHRLKEGLPSFFCEYFLLMCYFISQCICLLRDSS